VTLASFQDYLNNKRNPPPSANDCANVSGRDAGPDMISAEDQSLRELKIRIDRAEEMEKSIKYLRIEARISKRVALAELIGRYIEERDAKKVAPKKRQKTQSLKNRFIDRLFPETIKYKSQQLSKNENKQVIKEEKCPRQEAKDKFKYWLQLGEPLARMAKRYGIAVLVLLPDKLSDKE
jgi:hypothetical protein